MKLLIVIPAYNEEKIIRQNVLKLFDFLKNQLAAYDWQIVVADNNSTDKTREIVRELAREHKQVEYLFVEQKGKGAAIKTAWEKFAADIYCFMDADLATDLAALPKLITAIAKEGYDLAYGSRFAPGAQVERSLLRKVFSFGYRRLAKILLKIKISDLPCGFKAISQKVRDELLPKIKNQEWFFDSELLILAEKLGYRAAAIPVNWHEPRANGGESKVKVLSLSWDYFRKILAIKKRIKNVTNQNLTD